MNAWYSIAQLITWSEITTPKLWWATSLDYASLWYLPLGCQQECVIVN